MLKSTEGEIIEALVRRVCQELHKEALNTLLGYHSFGFRRKQKLTHMMVDWKCSEEHFEIVHIPDKPRIPPHLQPTVDVYASFIDPEHAHTLIRKLNQIAPLENLRHVKRVRRNRLEGGKIQLSAILCLACGNDCHLDGIPNAVLELITMYQLSTFITKTTLVEFVGGISKLWQCFSEHIHFSGGLGSWVKFWHDLWCGDDEVCNLSSALFDIARIWRLVSLGFYEKFGIQFSGMEIIHDFMEALRRILKRIVEGGLLEGLRVGELVKPMANWDRSIVRLRSYHGFGRKVCKYAALSREEWQEQCKLWPTSYHPPTYNIDGITGFSDEDSQSVLTFMKSAIDLAKSGDGEVVNASIIVDPSTNQVIASAVDQMLSWNTPINKIGVETSCIEKPKSTSFHSIINGVEDHGNLLLNGPKRMYGTVSCLHPWRWPKLQSCTSSSPWHPLRHAAIVAIELSAARDLRLFPRSENTGDNFDQADYMECPLTGSSPLKRQKTNAAIADEGVKLNCQNGCHLDSGRPYLCTGFDIYLVWEPCTMCAMALVHQRVKRIFYAFPNSFAGALGSVHRLQGEKSLNHHYAVFRVVLPEEVLGDG
ncbi:hypothetical protein RJ640_010415 [Escallonia rubra]|uniref:CMP/dCMP-type deaminase domain-containing protein n=1 Tax=Escallonia rubra TaxID=112253 RepID=A0AA88RC90_9ASTE|nr:hypothetical protein RJ640_010415 [Escallonia rubra]